MKNEEGDEEEEEEEGEEEGMKVGRNGEYQIASMQVDDSRSFLLRKDQRTA